MNYEANRGMDDETYCVRYTVTNRKELNPEFP
jgi:hypothetical protein